ncbi:hypothetical protein ACVWZL_007275 [Bradyrhizobium sp. GM2.4]
MNVATDEQRRQRLLRGCGRLDAGQADFPAVIETQTARIDRGDAAFALGLELARRGGRTASRDQKTCDDEMKQSRHVARKGCVALQP